MKVKRKTLSSLKKKQPKISTLKRKVWKLFSEYIRLRDCLETTGLKDYGKCITCSKIIPRTLLQAGHFIPGRHNANLFSEEGCHAQCLTKHSNLRMFNGQYKSISKIKIGDKLWGFDEQSLEKKMGVVEEVSRYIPKELYKIETESGKAFYATSDHMLVVNKKWAYVKDLLHSVITRDIMEL